jgi:hypothetical protein
MAYYEYKAKLKISGRKGSLHYCSEHEDEQIKR